nr:MAG TPA: hypothetical protein [Caudoviricetes sp.]
MSHHGQRFISDPFSLGHLLKKYLFLLSCYPLMRRVRIERTNRNQ